MKLTTTACIEKIVVDGKKMEVEAGQMLNLEFSAIDTGGGFHQPMIDFVFSVNLKDLAEIGSDKHKVKISVSDPVKEDNNCSFTYVGSIKLMDEKRLEGNGRLHEDRISDDLMAFIMKRLR